ncbi:MAG: quinolinate synthase NadA, partial [Pseudomonadota bacterium]
KKTRYPNAHIIAHPECPPDILKYAAHIGSTSSLLKFTKEHQGEEFIVLTEPGIIHQMKKASPNSIFHEAPGIIDGACVSCNNCQYMKLNTMEKLLACMKNKAPEISLSNELIEAARKPLERMLAMSQ